MVSRLAVLVRITSQYLADNQTLAKLISILKDVCVYTYVKLKTDNIMSSMCNILFWLVIQFGRAMGGE